MWSRKFLHTNYKVPIIKEMHLISGYRIFKNVANNSQLWLHSFWIIQIIAFLPSSLIFCSFFLPWSQERWHFTHSILLLISSHGKRFNGRRIWNKRVKIICGLISIIRAIFIHWYHDLVAVRSRINKLLMHISHKI